MSHTFAIDGVLFMHIEPCSMGGGDENTSYAKGTMHMPNVLLQLFLHWKLGSGLGDMVNL